MMRVLLVLVAAMPLLAQTVDPGAIGRAGAHDLSLKSAGALLWNPAVLGQTRTYKSSLELPSVMGMAANNSFSVGYWNDELAGDTFFDAAEKADILSRIPGDGWRANLQGSVPLIGFTYNRFAIGATLEAAGTVNVPHDLLQLALLGNELERSYAFADAANDQQVYNDYSAGFGYKFDQEYVPELLFGIGFHFYHGLRLHKIKQSQVDLFTDSTKLVGSGLVHTVTSNQGDGVGFDLGTMATLSDRWQVGLAVRQIGSRMTWQVDENDLISFYTDSAGLAPGEYHSEDFLDSALHKLDESFTGGTAETTFSPVIQANARFVPHAKWAVLGDFSARLEESVKGPAGVDFAVAGVYRTLPWLVLQSGAGGGNLWGPRVGIGAGLRFRSYEVDFGANWNGGVFNSARGLGLGLSHRILF